ncbi:hypothetical protein GCM10010424_06150 [Streptomyces lienomycini]
MGLTCIDVAASAADLCGCVFQGVSDSCCVMSPILPMRSPAARILPRFSPREAGFTCGDEVKATPAVDTISDRQGAEAL